MDPVKGSAWTEAQAERHLQSLELFGMRFGLDRMRRMTTVLGSPQRHYEAIHVLGTNGKTSTTRMIAAILQRHGLRTGAYTSPHLVSYCERVQIEERDLRSHEFAGAVARAAWAAEHVNRTLSQDDHVTQFELLTAAGLWEMGRREVQVAVVEAGLGGRYDATSVIEAPVSVLTNVGLEHTRWLGPTLTDIAEEKLAVVRPGGTLVLGSWLAADARAVAERVARDRKARIVTVEDSPVSASVIRSVSPDASVAQAPSRQAATGAFQARNFALARAAAEAHLQGVGIALDERAVRAAEQTTAIPGRLPVALRAAADRDRRRPQSRCRRGARAGAARSACRQVRRARAGRARGQGRGEHARRSAALLRAGLVHRAPEPARALAGGSRVARPPALLRERRLRAPAVARPRGGPSLGWRRRWARRVGDGLDLLDRRAVAWTPARRARPCRGARGLRR